jgi:hypothetical protein
MNQRYDKNYFENQNLVKVFEETKNEMENIYKDSKFI